jgi:aminoglycoside phosphotransferase (APT) family kinase protein
MLEVKFYDTVDDALLKFVVIISQCNGKWVLCKHKERDTYEVPGGHREVGEDILATAKRELQEETGAVKFDIKPLCVYSVTGKNCVNETGEESYGLLCFAEIEEFLGKLESEIEKVELMDELPENWTYPLIQPKLIEEWKRRQPWSDIAQSKEWKKIHKITKGWSADQKYKIHTKKGEVLLLRLADIEKYDEKKKEFDIITKYSKLGIPMSMPVEFGVCNQNRIVYMILTWVEGQDLETVLPHLSESEQYALGRLAGNILKKIHSIPVEESDIPAKTKVDKKIVQLSRYESSNVRINNDEIAVKYVKDNIYKIWKEKPVYQHGDFHPGNLIYMENGEIGVIDFNRWEVGDPYEEFYKLESFARELSVPYCIGQIQSYFDDEVPEVFWSVLAVYVAHASLFSIKWAEKFGQPEIDGMVERCMAAFKDYDYFRRNIPVWYEEKEFVNM